MNREQFFRIVEEHYGPGDVLRIKDAYIFAKEFHRGQKPRDGGERYFEHPRRVALLILDNGGSAADVVLGLLHDVVEDRYVPWRIIRRAFGCKVEQGTNLLSKVSVSDGPHGLVVKTKKDTGEYYRRIAQGPESVRLVKCCDRLDNIGDMRSWSPERRKKYILETRIHILPFAYLTNNRLARMLEDACRQAENGL